MIRSARAKRAVYFAFGEHWDRIKDSRDEFNDYFLSFVKHMYGSLQPKLSVVTKGCVDVYLYCSGIEQTQAHGQHLRP